MRPPTREWLTRAEWSEVWIAATTIDRETVVAEMDRLLDELGRDLALDSDEPAHIASRNTFRLFEHELEGRYSPIVGVCTPGKGRSERGRERAVSGR
jgi:hypothetical protein